MKNLVFFLLKVGQSNCNNRKEVLRTKQICDASRLSTQEVRRGRGVTCRGD